MKPAFPKSTRHTNDRPKRGLLAIHPAFLLITIMTGLLCALGGRAHAQTAPDLTGTYTADDGGIYYLQQSGTVLWWAGMSLDQGVLPNYVWHRGLNFTNVFRGTINNDNYTVTGEWADVTRGSILQSGTLTVSITYSPDAQQYTLTRQAATGGFGGQVWTQIAPLDDTIPDPALGPQDIVFRLGAVCKNSAAMCFLGNCACGGQSSLEDNLESYRDQTVLYGRLINTHELDECSITGCSISGFQSEIPHVNYGPAYDTSTGPISTYPDFSQPARDFATFSCYTGSDADFDLRFKADQNKLEDYFYETGWGNRLSGPAIYSLKFNDPTAHSVLNLAGSEAYVGLESIMYGKSDTCAGLAFGPPPPSLLPGWGDLNGNSVLINGQPINGSLTGSNCGDFIQPCPFLAPGVNNTNYLVNPGGIQIGNLLLSSFGDGKIESDGSVLPGAGTYMRVTGVLILDCGHWSDSITDFGDICDDDTGNPGQTAENQNQEIHPIYSIDVINSPYRPEDSNLAGRPNLTGAWGGTDGSTYYVRQIGNTIWLLGLMRDRQPMQVGTPPFQWAGCAGTPPSGIIGTCQLAPAFNANDPPCSTPGNCWAFANVFTGTITPGPLQDVIDGDWAGVPQSTSAGSSGGHMTFYVNNNKAIVPATDASIFPREIDKMYEPLDVMPPQSTLTIGNPSYQSGAGQLFVTSATPFMVSATDAGGSGVQNIWYRFFPQGSTAPAYTPVIASSAVFTLTGPDGIYEIDTYATDNAGNDESSHSTLVYLDNTPPVISIIQPTAASYLHSATLILSYSVNDTGSGVASVASTMDGNTTVGGQGLPSGQTINLLTELTLGTHTFTVTGVDNVGNRATYSINFSIIVTAQSIEGDVTQFLQNGAIKNAGVANSLLAKLNSAAAARTRGQCATAANIYQAFVNELQAQSGNGVVSVAAAIMISDAQYLVANCP